MKFRNTLVLGLALLVLLLTAAPFLTAQTLTQGDVLGTVTDPSGAVVPNAKVTIKNDNNGATQTRTTTGTGAYRFPLLEPGSYTLTFIAPSYRTITRNVTVTVGQATTVNTQMALAATEQTVTVTAEGSVLQADNPNVSTTMSSEQIHLTPNGGGDLSYIAQTAPGASINVQAGYGNFSSFGIPATSNNFTYNSMPENDPFLSLNNSGATNILLGQNDIGEASVVANGYSGQYSMQGANVNYVSRAGTNTFHGNAAWMWNGTYVNANNFFNNLNDAPRGFVNDNQWAGSFGGPIKKDKTFFFFDTEGLRVIVPVTRRVKVPTSAFETATLASVPAADKTFYQNMFNLYNNAPGSSRAANVVSDGGCADLVGNGALPAFAGFGAASPCALQYTSTQANLTHEYLITARVDQNIGPNDHAFVHFRTDQGVQATYTDPINSAFNLTSNQPQWEGQLQWVHTLSATTVNSFGINGSYYRAIFAQPSSAAALALQPVEVQFAGGSTAGALFPLGRDFSFPTPTPQGRNVTQYGFVEDLSHTRGNHSFKFGANFSRYDVTDYGIGAGSLPAVSNETLSDFVQGNATTLVQSFPNNDRVPINLYRLGLYVSDQWHIRKSLQLTFTVRADRNSNPNCATNCLSRLASDFGSIDHNINTPYNQSIISGIGNALPSNYNPWEVEPRFGFNWSPFGPNGNTVISGGFGIFSDVVPAVFVDSMLPNLPNDPTIQLSGLRLNPTAPNSATSNALAAANALRTGFFNGATLASLTASVPNFSAPNFFNPGSNISAPRAQEWNFQVQHSIGPKMVFSLNYVGNHGIHQEINNSGVNAFCGGACLSSLGISSFNGLPTAPTDSRFLQVTQLTTGFNSNYNGLTVSFLRRLSALQFQLNYTWSHALDYASNNGVGTTPFNFNTNVSITNPVNPFNPTQNMYGNSDYDMRHTVTLNYVWDTPKNWMHGFLGGVLAGWTVGGTAFWHTGTPYTIIDSGTGGALNPYGYGGGSNIVPLTFANNIGGVGTLTCNGTYANPGVGGCPGMLNNFAPAVSSFGSVRRNQAYGPKFFDTDLTIMKNFRIPGREGMTLAIGATAYNLFNHPNFDQAVQDVNSGSFGTIQSTVNAPTSIYGSFLGADASPRLIQSQIRFTF